MLCTQHVLGHRVYASEHAKGHGLTFSASGLAQSEGSNGHYPCEHDFGAAGAAGAVECVCSCSHLVLADAWAGVAAGGDPANPI